MKLAISLLFFAVIFTVTSVSEATNARHKRALAREYCPKNASDEQCEEYAKSVSKTLRYCHTFSVYNQMITWASCGTVECGENLKVFKEDLNKPYPQCCKTCALE